MKKLAVILCLSALATGAFAQGLVSFGNGPTSLISQGTTGNTSTLAAGNAGGYYFALLTSASSTGPFTFAGIYGTNSGSAGRIAAGTYPVTGWQPGATMSYEVAGWSSIYGATFVNGWLTAKPGDAIWGGKAGFFGVSAVGTGAAGGGSPVPAPALPLFGGSGLAGFVLGPVGTGSVPEPTSMALAGLGAAALLIFRRRK